MKTRTLRSALLLCGLAMPSVASAQQGDIVLHADRLLDGRGGVQQDRDVVVRGGRIVQVLPGGQGRGDVDRKSVV